MTLFEKVVFVDVIKLRIVRWAHPVIRVLVRVTQRMDMEQRRKPCEYGDRQRRDKAPGIPEAGRGQEGSCLEPPDGVLLLCGVGGGM